MPINAGNAVAYLTLDHSGFSSGLKSAGQDFKSFMDSSKSGTERIKSLSSGLTSAGTTLTKSVTLPIIGAGAVASKAAIDFESAFTGVRKTVDGTEEQFKELEKSIRNMAKSMPESASEISGVAEAAGQLGIQTEKIEGFTKTMVMLGDSTNLSSEQAATSLARLANITGMSQDNFSNLGSVIVALGNNMATTESEITEMGLRLAGAGSQVGMSEAQIMSFAAALSSVGIEAEAGGSAFSKVMVDMQLAVETGGDALTDFSKVAGMSSGEFKKAFKEDAATAMISFISGLSKCEEKGISAIKVLDDMGITEVRMRDALLRAAGASDKFTDAIDLGNKAWDENSALSKEAETRYGTTESKIAILKNKFVDMGITLGQALLPTIQVLVEKVGAVVDWFSNLDEGTRNTIVKFGLLAAAAGPVLIMGGKLISSVTSLVGAGKSLVTGIGKIPGLLSKLPVVGSKIGSVFSKLGPIFKTGASEAVPLAKGMAGVGSSAKTALTPVGMAAAKMSELGMVTKVTGLLFNPWTLGIAAAGVAAVAVGKKLSEDVVPKVDLFEKSITKAADGTVTGSVKISDATKEAVGAYMEMDKKATESLLNMRFSGEVITTEMANNIQSQFSQMSNTIITELDSDYQKGLSSLQSMFSSGTEMTSEQQSLALEKLKQHHDNKKIETESALNEINRITRTAAEENRATTDLENQEIDRLQNVMRTNAIKCLSEQEIESNVIIDRMAAYNGRVTAETVGEHVRLLEEQRIKAIDTANREYQERIAVAEQIRAEGGAEAEASANEIIAAAEKQRNEVVEKANKTKEDGIDKLALSYKNLRGEVDTNTGEILSFWGQLKNWWDNNNFAKKTITAEFVEENKKVQSTRPMNGGIGQALATGSFSARRGRTLVGENGPEIIDLKGGERVYNAAETRRILNDMTNTSTVSNQEGIDFNNLIKAIDDLKSRIDEVIESRGINFNVDKFENNSEKDIEQIAQELEYFRRAKLYGQ